MKDVAPGANAQHVSVAELAGHLQVSKDTIYSLARQGVIPAFRVGRLWRFRVVDVESALQASSDLWAPPSRRKVGKSADG